jgi:dTDP-4-dehydrorhamnose 3,5-epimerase
MKILEVKTLIFTEVKLIKFQRFSDNRGYFTETYRRSDFENQFLKNLKFVQANESYSKKGVIRGLHFQWNPYMGKLVRVISGHIIDLFLDIRKNSPTFGKIAGYELASKPDDQTNEWIWIPVGFAHGVVYLEESTIEYLCTGEYSPNCEAGISPLASDIDWSICDKKIKSKFDKLVKKGAIISEKDKQGLTAGEWNRDKRAENFIYGEKL